MDNIIQVEGLSKDYGTVRAVQGIDFAVRRGCFFAFLGPNGAGKSTTIGILCTLLRQSAGRAFVAGHEVGRADTQIRQSIGALFQNNILDQALTVEENLTLRARLYGLSRAERAERLRDVSETLEISGFMSRRYGKLSGGQKRRAEIARALLHRPEVLILDEPTTGLDPQTRRSVWKAVERLRRDTGLTVFLTTHYMEEAAAADAVAVIDHGVLVAQDTPRNLRAAYAPGRLTLTPARADGTALAEALNRQNCPFTRDASGVLVLPVSDSGEALRLLNELQGLYTSFEKRNGDMDDVFLNITGRAIREGGTSE